MEHIKTLYEWRDVKGFEGLYQVNQFGQVKGVKRKKLLKLQEYNQAGHGKTKYHVVNLCKDGKAYHKQVHRLVAEAFIPNPDNYDTVDHIDCNGLNNCVLNLRWMSALENSLRGQITRKYY